ncbi:MAG TPA: Hpt domain-containing protein [Candidatus Thermoplasmatota archaeon]|nr:Hpt domain-containing protein [Candidatus Thermoplasmatota archaeon]
MPSALDQTTLRKLERDIGADADTMRELIDTFLGEGPRIVQTLEDAARTGAVKEVNRAAHSLKSTAATFGATQLSTLCRELERDTTGTLPADVQARVRALAAEWARVRAELEALRP